MNVLKAFASILSKYLIGEPRCGCTNGKTIDLDIQLFVEHKIVFGTHSLNSFITSPADI